MEISRDPEAKGSAPSASKGRCAAVEKTQYGDFPASQNLTLSWLFSHGAFFWKTKMTLDLGGRWWWGWIFAFLLIFHEVDE